MTLVLWFSDMQFAGITEKFEFNPKLCKVLRSQIKLWLKKFETPIKYLLFRTGKENELAVFLIIWRELNNYFSKLILAVFGRQFQDHS